MLKLYLCLTLAHLSAGLDIQVTGLEHGLTQYLTGPDGVTLLPHDEVDGVENDFDNTEDYPPRMWLPTFYNALEGCVPYSAVDLEGRASNGLKAVKSWGKRFRVYAIECSAGYPQVYFRNGTIRNQFAMAYTVYLPKEEAIPVLPWQWHGKRSIFKTAILWFKNDLVDQASKPMYISLMDNGQFKKYRPGEFSVYPNKNSHGGGAVRLESRLFSLVPSRDGEVFGEILTWEDMPPAMQNTFNIHSWGSDVDQNFPLSDKNWFATMVAAL